MNAPHAHYVLAFDTANEVISLAVGELDFQTRAARLLAQRRIAAHRSSNTKLLPSIDALLGELGVQKGNIACVVCGRGPGSFTGVRICIATAKGVASALEVPLVGVSTLDALAWELQLDGHRGGILVLADAMRKEVYPVRYSLGEGGIGRMGADAVMPAALVPGRFAGEDGLLVCGDALFKYAQDFAGLGQFAEEDFWTLKGAGLLAAFQSAWRAGLANPSDAVRHDPGLLLPVYTRLSDAEENERARKASTEERDLRTGVQAHPELEGHETTGLRFQPLDAAQTEEVARLEAECMGSDAWSAAQVADELPRKDRSWWAATSTEDGSLVGYVGGRVTEGELQLFKVAVTPGRRRSGAARFLVALLAADARDLGATSMSLEVRASNAGAQAFYRALGLEEEGRRPRYYSDGEDALIFAGPLPAFAKGTAGMELFSTLAEASHAEGKRTATRKKPLILAIESSCDETAAAVIDGSGEIMADTVASQVDFHARFGGVVPEIASRKHIEAICGVTQACLEQAAARAGAPKLRWRDLSAVAVTYAPGLVGALVVGVAFGKGAAWAADTPFIGVNHLEGHLYANKLAEPGIQPPLVVSLVSGGHTMLVHVRAWGSYEVLGSTIDDAVGEAFDKVAKALGLGYPGGPVISKLAKEGNPEAIPFPRAMLHSGDLRFSLSGLKTAVVTYINQQQVHGAQLNVPDIAASFQAAVIDVQVAKAEAALKQTGAREFCLGGGVAANPELRAAYQRMCDRLGVRLTLPPLSACTDNASMIALVALDRYAQGKFFGLDADAFAHTNLEEPY